MQIIIAIIVKLHGWVDREIDSGGESMKGWVDREIGSGGESINLFSFPKPRVGAPAQKNKKRSFGSQ